MEWKKQGVGGGRYGVEWRMLDSWVHILVDHLTFEKVGGGVWGWKVLVMARIFFPQ